MAVKVRSNDPELIAFFGEYLQHIPIDNTRVEEEAIGHYNAAPKLIMRYVVALENFRRAKMTLEAATAAASEDLRQYHRVTEAAMKSKIRVQEREAHEAHAKAETELEAIKMMMKLFYDRGEMLKALLWARQQEFKAAGVGSYGNAAAAAKQINQKWSK